MYDVPTPKAISVNMFGLRCTSDSQARSKNGQPHHNTTGVASRSWIQLSTRMSSRCSRRPGTRSLIAMEKTGTDPRSAACDSNRPTRLDAPAGSCYLCRAMPRRSQETMTVLPGPAETVADGRPASRRRWRHKFRDALRGLKLGVRGQSSFFVHFFFAVLVLAAAIVLRCPLEQWCLLLLSMGLVLAAELFNSAVETLFRG